MKLENDSSNWFNSRGGVYWTSKYIEIHAQIQLHQYSDKLKRRVDLKFYLFADLRYLPSYC